MGFKAIPTGEKVSQPSMQQGPPPKHTEPGHEDCAYYLDVEVTTRGGVCPHGELATGAFYSEDYVRELTR